MLSSYFFDETVNIRSMLLKTEQTIIVYTQWDRWTSYDMIKHLFWWLLHDILSHYMISIYLIVHIQLSFVQLSLLCKEFWQFSEKRLKWEFIIVFSETMKSSSFQKLAKSTWICRINCDCFLDLFSLLAINSNDKDSSYFWKIRRSCFINI